MKTQYPTSWLEKEIADLNKQLNAYTATEKDTEQELHTNKLKANFVSSKARTQEPQIGEPAVRSDVTGGEKFTVRQEQSEPSRYGGRRDQEGSHTLLKGTPND